MPKLLIELSGAEYDALVGYAKGLRRTPSAQAAQIVADAMEAFLKLAAAHDNSAYHASAGGEVDGAPLPGALAAEQEVAPQQG